MSSPSVYETLRQHDESSDTLDVEERAGMGIDEENLGHRFEEDDLDHADAAAALGESPATSDQTTPFLPDDGKSEREGSPKQHGRSRHTFHRPRWMTHQAGILPAEEGDDEVPASLLIEAGQQEAIDAQTASKAPVTEAPSPPVPGPSTVEVRAQWQRVRAQQNLYASVPSRPMRRKPAIKNWRGLSMIDPRERAMWRWANVDNLDNFLKDVYDYYLGNGIWSIMLNRALNLLSVVTGTIRI